MGLAYFVWNLGLIKSQIFVGGNKAVTWRSNKRSKFTIVISGKSTMGWNSFTHC